MLPSTSGDSESTEEVSVPHKRKEPKKKIMTQRIASALDAYRITDRAAFHAISAVLSSLGLSIDNYVISRDYIGTFRKEERQKIAANVKQNFKVSI